MPRLHSGAATDRPKTTHLKLSPIPEVVWQQPQETDVPNIYQTFSNENTHMPESKHTSDVESQMSPIKETSAQVSVSHTEPLLGNQTRSALVSSLNDSKKPGQKFKELTLT